MSARFPVLAVLFCAWAATPLALAAPPDDPRHIHRLEELAGREGKKPYSLLREGDLYASERTIFHDTATGAETWRLTHESGNDRHGYYDIPAWNRDGSVMIINHGSRLGSNQWLVAADGSWMRPLDPSGGSFTNAQWSWLDRRWIYYLRGGSLWRIDWTLGARQMLFDLAHATGIDARQFRLEVPHPANDRLLFDTRSAGRFFTLAADGTGLHEIPTDGRWKASDAIHRFRWMKSSGNEVFLGQNTYLDSTGRPVRRQTQYVTRPDDSLAECNLFDGERADHLDTSVEGRYITGGYRSPIKGSLWLLDTQQQVAGRPLARLLYASATDHHSSNTWDGRWHVTDNSQPEGGRPITIGGLTTIDSHVLVSFDGRAQVVLNYHYSSYSRDENTHPAPVSSPDGTKVMYDSDMLRKGEIKGESTGNADVWLVVVRRPSPPRGLEAHREDGAVRLDWKPPCHAEREIYWNPGNLARETRGYCVFRAEKSGGPYASLHDGLVTETAFVDRGSRPDATAYYVVQAIEHSGLASLFSAEACAAPSGAAWQGDVCHYDEAEEGRLQRPMVPQMDWRAASGGWYVAGSAAEPDPNYPLESFPARVTLTLHVPRAGDYALWFRARRLTSDGARSIDIATTFSFMNCSGSDTYDVCVRWASAWRFKLVRSSSAFSPETTPCLISAVTSTAIRPSAALSLS